MSKIIDDLIACGVPSDTLLAVVKLIAAAEIAEKNRSQTRDRVQRFRDRKRNETLRNVSETLPSPAYISKKDKIDKKEESIDSAPKVRPVKKALPADFTLTESDIEHATSRGWSRPYAESEFSRFRDHATANGRKQVDWRAAWRNWVTSPYQKTNGGQNGKTRKNCADVGRELFEQFSREERDAAVRQLPQIGSRRP
jgi:hypothetical protein